MKALLKYLAKRFYQVGFYENQVEKFNEKILQFKEICIFEDSVKFYDETIIENHQNNKTKINIGKNTVLRGFIMLFKCGGEIVIGNDCFIGPDTKIWSAKKITIGNRVLISHNVNIHDNISHPLNSVERHLDFKHIFSKGFQDKTDLNEKEIVIEDDVWIGFNSIILKGVRIGKGAIVGAGTIITKDVPPYSIIVGNPPRIIKKTD